MLKNFVRNNKPFKELSKSIKVIRTIDFYEEFLNLGKYFNDILKKEFENIINNNLLTTPDKFLINIGDGTIDWVDIVDIIEDNSILLNKFYEIHSKSVLCSDDDGNITPIRCDNEYEILFARHNKTHIWRKLTNEDILEQSITGTQIDSLEQLNLEDDVTNNFITTDLLETHDILDKSISSYKIIDETLEDNLFNLPNNETKTGLLPDKYVTDIGVNNIDAFSTGFLTPEKILNDSIDPNKNPKLFSLREYSDDPIYLHRNLYNGYQYPENFNLSNAEVLESFNIQSECLEDAHLIPYIDIGNLQNIPWHDNPLEPRYFTQGYIVPTEDCMVEGRCIAAGQLRLRHFDDEVRTALENIEVTDDD